MTSNWLGLRKYRDAEMRLSETVMRRVLTGGKHRISKAEEGAYGSDIGGYGGA